MSPPEVLNYYTRQSPWSDPGRFYSELKALPDDIPTMMGVIQQLLVYDGVCADFYGYRLPPERMSNINLRPLETILERILGLDARSLLAPRPVEKRVASRCRGFVLFMVGVLRAQGIPARARCGFGTYFRSGYFEDHWVCEYWDYVDDRWKFADPQFDAVWADKLTIDHDVADVPRDRFIVAADCWEMCRNGSADPDRFGVSFVGLHGLWFVAGTLVREIAALAKEEMLPWDTWGAHPAPGAVVSEQRAMLFDRVAQLTRDPDHGFRELHEFYASNEVVRVPNRVHNAVTNRMEAVA